METRPNVFRWFLRTVAIISLVVIALSPALSRAGDLDSAVQFWQLVNVQLGGDSTIIAIDTMPNFGAIQLAVNSCVRDWATAVGITGYQAIRLSAATFQYKLNSGFIADGATNVPWSVTCISADGQRVWGLAQQKDAEDFGNLVDPGLPPRRWSVVGDTIWVVPMGQDGDGAVLRISGPIVGATMTAGSDTTNVPDEDRGAVCDCATAKVGLSIDHPRAQFYWDLWTAHVQARGGRTEVIAGGQ